MRSVWIFVITLAVIVSALGIVLYNVIDNGDLFGGDPVEATDPPADAPETEKTSEPAVKGKRTFLLIGTDYQPDELHDYASSLTSEGRKICADAIMILQFSADGKYVMFSTVDTKAFLNEYSPTTIGETYSEGGASYTAKCVSELTGLRFDAYICASIPVFTKALDKLGKFTVNVPVDMKYSDPWQNLEIDLRRGTQSLDAGQVMQLLRYDSYTDGNYDRGKVAVMFAESLLSKVTGGALSGRIQSIYKEVVPTLETNYSSDAFGRDLSLLLLYPELEKRTVAFATRTAVRGEDVITVPDSSELVSGFLEYR